MDKINEKTMLVVSASDLRQFGLELIQSALGFNCESTQRNEDELLTISEAAALLGVCKTTFWKLKKQGRIREIRLGKRNPRYSKNELLGLLK
ncbi:MAG: helix-turn-helix domain-containing protein [Bacteroidaceae bacterium]|nr:helix-turn-helix domain-containing protein [Bacteroidaceae bacterium]